MPSRKTNASAPVIEPVETALYGIPVISGIPFITITMKMRIIKHRKTVKHEAYNELYYGLPSVNKLIELAGIQGNITTKKGVNNRFARGGPAKALIATTRKQVRLKTLETMELVALEPPHLKWCLLVAQVYFPDRRVRDAHNLLFKAGIDGLSDAGLIGNDRGVALFIPLPIISKSSPRMEFQVYPMPDSTDLRDET